MKMNKFIHALAGIGLLVLLASCHSSRKSAARPAEARVSEVKSRIVLRNKVPPRKINTKDVNAEELVRFAEKLVGTRYRYGSADPSKGFDCSGFIYYVFSNFGISVPRSSVDFTNAGREVPIEDARRGDIILFTGSNASSGVVGHMGIVSENRKGLLKFIHSASGNNAGVMISGMNRYFVERFVKVNRIFPDEKDNN